MVEPKRDTKGFEPPPWEREAFEELRRRREGEAADREISEAVGALSEPAEGPTPAEPGPEPPAPEREAAEPGEPGPGEEPPRAAGEARSAAEDLRVTAMLAELAATEPQPLRDMWVVEVGSGVFLGLLGVIVFVWGLIGGARSASNPGAMPFALVMIVFGASFAALGLWLIRRGLRNRGVA